MDGPSATRTHRLGGKRAGHPVTPMDEGDLRVHLARQTARKIALLDILALSGEDEDAEACQEILAWPEERGEEVGRVADRSGDVAKRDQVDFSRPAAAELEVDRGSTAGDRAPERAAEIQTPAAPCA